MDALILAAGRGSRLEQQKPKCLVKIGGKRLIDWQLEALSSRVDGTVHVVAGYRWERVRDAVGDRGNVIVNDRWGDTNSLASFALARDLTRKSSRLMVLNSDVFFHPWMLRFEGNMVVYDSSAKFDPEQMKLLIRHDRVVSLSKSLPKKYMAGENVGLWSLLDEELKTAFKAAERILEKKPQAWVPAALNVVAESHVVRPLDVAGLPWIEIDYPSDLSYARRVVLPAIKGD